MCTITKYIFVFLRLHLAFSPIKHIIDTFKESTVIMTVSLPEKDKSDDKNIVY